MDVFSLRDTVVGQYKQFATSFTTIFAEDIRQKVDAIYAQERYWPEPLIQINPNYKRTTTVAKLVTAGALEPACSTIFSDKGEPLTLYKHQEQAIAAAAARESYVVTTGTGSGKSLCFFIPIVNAVLADKPRSEGKRTRAIVIYPMNALANSQQEELDKYIKNVAGERPVTFARYTGQDDTAARIAISENPPDILLTNFMMLELLMTRQDDIDRRVIGNCRGLNFLVLDELHTYRGRQGADVALLVRRVREQLSPKHLQCIGTSATMASGDSVEDKRRAVANVATRLFATKLDPSQVIVETLDRQTNDKVELDGAKLGAAIDKGIPANVADAALRDNQLAVWVETRLGINWSEGDQRWERARPRTVTEAVEELAKASGRSEANCRHALRNLLLTSSVPENKRRKAPDATDRSFFAFKLHQFISGAGHAFITLEKPSSRSVTVEGQQFLPGHSDKRLFSVHFCRECGHEYHPVRRIRDGADFRFHARDIDDAPIPKADADRAEDDTEELDEDELFGFLTLHAADEDFGFADDDQHYPETWIEYDAKGQSRIKSNYRPYRAREYFVDPSGKAGSGERAWFLPGKFRFCLRCKTTHTSAARDRNRLASLSAEGRSSATTVLVASALRWMHGDKSGLDRFTRKLLGFTDNRQDAALQSGHFNDFLFVTLIRAAFLRALRTAGTEGIPSEELGDAQQRALGFDAKSDEIRAEWLLQPSLHGVNLAEAERTLREVLAYRVWFDQRRGWRYTNPNLEQLGLVAVDYNGIDALANDEKLFTTAPDLLANASPATRTKVFRALFDHLRMWMAVKSQILEQTSVEQIRGRSHNWLRAPWGFGSDEQPRRSRWLLTNSPNRRANTLRDEDLIVRGGSRSGLGRVLRDHDLWDNSPAIRAFKPKEFDALVSALLEAAKVRGLVSEDVTPFADRVGWRLNASTVRFKVATPEDKKSNASNAFFRGLYENLAELLDSPGHPLFGFEAREHTAQVENEKRLVREKRFRFGKKEQQELGADEKRLRELGEAGRFLPVLFCSPTMELGVDISALNAVYLRNVPPTPANYAQRSGRAGRSGQAALVLTYCSSQSPHDQYFFRDPREMVHGAVRPPLLDLANHDLVVSHLHAVWLACTQQPLHQSIAELLVLDDKTRPLKDEVRSPMEQERVATEAKQRIRRVLDLLESELTPDHAPWYPGRDVFADAVVQSALSKFDDAFARWRELLASAEVQRDAARKIMDSYSSQPRDKEAAKSRQAQAFDQIKLLQAGTSSSTSDFYTYRYLATEGFLPGYNFPRLPLMAYVPATGDGGGRQTYLQRPRFLALSEFGPRSLVYHEGRAYRVVRAMLSLGGKDSATPDVQLPTKSVRICRACGGGHFSDAPSVCHACGAPLGDAEIINDVFRIENVATQPAERITANDEERQRQGFELQTTFEWAIRDGAVDVRPGVAADDDGEILKLSYGPGATITRLNKGLRRRADRKKLGFKIDPISGYWAKNDDEDATANTPDVNPRQPIVPSVHDRKNALLMQPSETELEDKTFATVQHALLRGIEAVYQLEEGEILAEPMPSRADRNGFLLYEATEGGAGVLTRLVTDETALRDIARKALEVMHFDVEVGKEPPADSSELTSADTSCVAACYRCLMSYFNQPDHELIDRRDEDAQNILLRLARSTTRIVQLAAAPSKPEAKPTTPAARWLAAAAARGLPSPDAKALIAAGTTFELVWRDHFVAAILGTVDKAAAGALTDRGFELISFNGSDEQWTESFSRLAKALGR